MSVGASPKSVALIYLFIATSSGVENGSLKARFVSSGGRPRRHPRGSERASLRYRQQVFIHRARGRAFGRSHWGNDRLQWILRIISSKAVKQPGIVNYGGCLERYSRRRVPTPWTKHHPRRVEVSESPEGPRHRMKGYGEGAAATQWPTRCGSSSRLKRKVRTQPTDQDLGLPRGRTQR